MTHPILTPVAINVSASGNNVVVAASPYRQWPCILVLRYTLKVANAVTIQWLGSQGSTLSGPMPFVSAGDGVIESFDPGGYFLTAPGDDLILNLSGDVAVGGYLLYDLATANGTSWSRLVPFVYPFDFPYDL